MSDEGVPIEDWLDVAVEAFEEVATGSLECETCEVTGHQAQPIESPAGAYVPLVTSTARLQVGLVASAAACVKLTRDLLFMEADEEDPDLDDIADAVGEIVNIVAGVVQRQLAARVGEVELGLPLFIRGVVHTGSTPNYAVATMNLGDTPVTILVLGSAGSAAKKNRTRSRLNIPIPNLSGPGDAAAASSGGARP